MYKKNFWEVVPDLFSSEPPQPLFLILPTSPKVNCYKLLHAKGKKIASYVKVVQSFKLFKYFPNLRVPPG